jgi:hypothetical protein
MAVPSLPTPLEQLGRRPFSFYPPILGIERNEWLFRRATWPEVLVTNAHTGEQVAIPRRFLGEVSRIEEPIVIVGLLKELEFRDGAVWPHRRAVLQMPLAAGAETYPERRHSGPAPVIGISLHSETHSRRSRQIVGAVIAAVLAALAVAGALRESYPRSRPVYRHIPR